MIEENSVYNYKDLEDIFKIKIRTLSKYIKSGVLKPTKFGNKYRFLGSELLRFTIYMTQLQMG
jgi:predicted site-specific integrase-resolvase